MLRKPLQFLLLVLAASAFISAGDWEVTGDLPLDIGGPVEMAGTDWAEDVLVTTRDSVLQVILDRASNGHLFCCYRFLGDGYVVGLGVAMSTDGGATWTETANLQYGYVISDVGMACMGEFVYVACAFWSGAAAYRLNTTTGLRVPFHSGGMQVYFDSFPALTEIEVMGEVGYGSAAVCFALMDSSGRLRVRQMDTAGTRAWQWDRQMRDASRGLSLGRNRDGYITEALMSYIDTLGRIKVYGLRLDTGGIYIKYDGPQTAIGDYTSVSGWHDTLIVFFDYQSGNRQARYRTSYDGGSNWYWGVVGDTTASFTRSAAVVADGGVGQGVVFWQYPQNGSGVSFTWRDYSGPWSTPVSVHDYSSISTRQNAIEHLGAGQYGIVYFRGTQNGMAYFDRSDWTGVRDEGCPGAAATPLSVSTVVRGILRLQGSSPAELVDETGRLVMTLEPGENDIRHVAPGIYVLRSAESAKRSAMTKVVIQR